MNFYRCLRILNKAIWTIWPIASCLIIVLLMYSTSDLDSPKRLKLRLNTSSSFYVPWPWDAKCSHYQLRLAVANSLPLVGLVSFPRSGNTWTRYMIEASTGVFTGSIYSDGQLYSSGMLGELQPYDDGTTIVQKTHVNAVIIKNQSFEWRRDHVRSFSRIILVIRDPFRAIASYWRFRQTKKNGPMVSPEISSEQLSEFRLFARDLGFRWRQLVEDCLKSNRDVLLVIYEDLRKDPITQIRRIMSFLPVDLSSEDVEGRMSCLRSYLDGKFKDEHAKNAHNDKDESVLALFGVELVDFIKSNVVEVNQMLEARLRRSLPVERYAGFR